MAKPLIGITLDHTRARDRFDQHYNYARRVSQAGGVPFLLPFTANTSDIAQMLCVLDGVLLSGGNDLDPAAWDEPRHPLAVPIDPEREQFDSAVLAEAERRRLPILGICLGMQLMVVRHGGALHQFLPDLEPSLAEHRVLTQEDWQRRHDVTLAAGSVLASALGAERCPTNSSHKQAVRDAGELTVSARAGDGVIEAVERTGGPFFLGVQWHPERMDEPLQLKLFEALIHACRS